MWISMSCKRKFIHYPHRNMGLQKSHLVEMWIVSILDKFQYLSTDYEILGVNFLKNMHYIESTYFRT